MVIPHNLAEFGTAATDCWGIMRSGHTPLSGKLTESEEIKIVKIIKQVEQT